MSNNHYSFNSNSIAPAARLARSMQTISDGWEQLNLIRGIMIQMKVNGASGDDVFADITTAFGYQNAATAAASFAEIDSCFSNSDAAVTQMLNRHL